MPDARTLAIEALEDARCTCKSVAVRGCPQCGTALQEVTNDSRYLNDEQFASIRAGDYYCTHCTSEEAKSGYKYWWARELQHEKYTCKRCNALAALRAEPQPTGANIIREAELCGARELAERLKADAYAFGALGVKAVPVESIDAMLAEMEAAGGMRWKAYAQSFTRKQGCS